VLCESERARRGLRERWPYRRFDSRPDLHLLHGIRQRDCMMVAIRSRRRPRLGRRTRSRRAGEPRRPSSR
jgi:hypothetical protein